MNCKPSSHRSLIGVLFSLAVASTISAQAAVAPATYNIATRNDGVTASYTSPGTYSIPNGSVSVSTKPFTLLTSRSAPVASSNVGSYAIMDYFFQIVGTAGNHVSGTFTADMFASVATNAFDEETIAGSSFRLFSTGPGSFYNSSNNVIANGPSQQLRQYVSAGTLRFNSPVNFIVDANAMYGVELVVQTQTTTPGEVVNASIDPVITIDPAFRSAYLLVLSDGISNFGPTATITPEPGSLVLVGGGLFAVAGVLRRRRTAM